MLDLLTIALEAHSDELNHHRRYEVSVGRDLLGDWVVTVRFGRVGGPLRELRFGSPDAEEARAIVHDRLRRRMSAPKRIGCGYGIRELSVPSNVNAGEWVPPAVLAGLLPEATYRGRHAGGREQ
ncbi:MAG: molybdenum metabolism regulator [Planctomycetes bacterium]|nr:molybdenum metabolism regulator [Planctomycetota bacterium]